jgi:hypothetical protein
MTDTPQTLISVALARQALAMQLLRILLRDRAAAHDQTPEDILKWSEEIKKFFEERTTGVNPEAYLTAAIDEFFNLLASEVRADRENR